MIVSIGRPCSSDYKQHPRRALEGRRDHDFLARIRVPSPTFVVLVSIVNDTVDRTEFPLFEKNDVCLLCHTPQIRRAWLFASGRDTWLVGSSPEASKPLRCEI